MSDVIFDEERKREKGIFQGSQPFSGSGGGLPGFLVRKGLMKSERAANVVLVLIALLIFVVSLFFWF